MSFYLKKVPTVLQKLFPEIIWCDSFHTEEQYIYLTFDDGPHPESTPTLMTLLENAGVSASFFVTGARLKDQTRYVEECRSRGHFVGNHGYDHVSPLRQDFDSFCKDVRLGSSLSGSNVYRPPFGRLNFKQLKWLTHRFRVVMWSLMPGDFDRRVNSEGLARTICRNAKRGSIIVLHDRPDCIAKLAPVFDGIVESLTSKGYRFKTINHLL